MDFHSASLPGACPREGLEEKKKLYVYDSLKPLFVLKILYTFLYLLIECETGFENSIIVFNLSYLVFVPDSAKRATFDEN